VKDIVDRLTHIQVEIDGVPVKDVEQYRATTPVFDLTLPEVAPPDQNIIEFFGCSNPPGTYGPCVAEAYALILAPLSVGEHTIHETLCSDDLFPSPCVDITWHITVVPGHR